VMMEGEKWIVVYVRCEMIQAAVGLRRSLVLNEDLAQHRVRYQGNDRLVAQAGQTRGEPTGV
jgi:hypothetical protein